MNKRNNWKRDFLGVTAWHKAGYMGFHGLTASAEDYDSGTQHARQTYDVFKEIAPSRRVVYIPFASNVAGFVAATHARGVDTVYVSKSGLPLSLMERNLLNDRLDPRTSVFVAAGNYGRDKASLYMAPETVYGVGAAKLYASEIYQGEAVEGSEKWLSVADYTSISPLVDFAGVTDFYDSTNHTFGGTSCATPVIAGMAALVNDFFIQHTGKPLKHVTMYRFLQDCAVDIGVKGKDDRSGWGVPILPHPKTIDIERWTDMDKYADDNLINDAHRADVYAARELGLMLGDDHGRFNPKDRLTREQAASVIVRLYKMLTDKR